MLPSDALAYFLTFTTYGTWVHGDPRGSVDRWHNFYNSDALAPAAGRLEYVRAFRLKGRPFLLEGQARLVADAAVREVAEHKAWPLFALNVRTNHVHAVLRSDCTPEFVLQTLKAWCTRRLREAGLVGREQRVWTRHGSTRYVWNDSQLERVCHYVIHGQSVAPDDGRVEDMLPRTLTDGRGSDMGSL